MPFDMEGSVLALQAMKPFAVLLMAGCVYAYATIRTKTLLEGPNRTKLCEYIITKRACSVLAKL